ncbi:intradiol ring-cleavage dioxygenase [Nonomuraea africana]|uniref:intradiol ring-cleavage dioxygenase n=1 Tax=Nonomuraea africana TaxID=46171 RepID=UPI003407A599
MSVDHEGQRVSRRAVIAGIGGVGLSALLAACAEGGTPVRVATSAGGTATITPTTAATGLDALFEDAGTCTLTEETTQGPYHFDADRIRSDIREDRQGATLRVAIRVQDAGTCAPISGAVVEIWHCDAMGLYSGFEERSRDGGGPSDDERYLRGAQVTNKEGIVEFTTIYPGWYRGRTVHIHAMVHVSDERVLTTQTMFDEAVTAEVYGSEPYTAHAGRDTFNDDDGIFEPSMVMKTVKEAGGYLGVITFAVRPTG